MTDIQLFECFNIELQNGGMLWKVKNRANDAAKKLTVLAGEPGSKERIAAYRAQAEANLPLFEDEDNGAD